MKRVFVTEGTQQPATAPWTASDGTVIASEADYTAYLARLAAKGHEIAAHKAAIEKELAADATTGEPAPGPVVEVDLSQRPDICAGPLREHVPTTANGGQAELSEMDLQRLREGR